MLWKLDFLLSIKVAAKGFAGNGSQNLSTNDSSERKKSSDATDASECDDPENDQFAEDGNAKQDDYKDISKPSEEELRFASILEIEQSDDPEKIKNNYRKIIAQYHPDRVRALGPEIREVAEKKAKEINEAYEYFRNKFKA